MARPLATIIMKQKTIYVLILLLISLSCNRQSNYPEYSNSLIDCIHSKDSSLLGYLDKFEEFLINKKVLHDTSKTSYLKLIENAENDIVEINIHELGEYVFNDAEMAWNYFSPIKYGIFVQCINSKKIEFKKRYFFDLAGKVLMKSSIDELAQIELRASANSGSKRQKIEYSEIPDELFENRFIHYCFLMSLYSELL